MRREIARSMFLNAAILGLFAVATVGTVTALQQGTKTRIQAAERAAQVRALGEVLPPGSYDNDLLAYARPVDAQLGAGAGEPAYLALTDGEPSAVILPVVAPDGYSGAIRLLVGIRADGQVAGVRVVSHRETPGLGDKMERAKSDWILGFNGKSLSNPDDAGWAVRKDGGTFDAFTGATITPRAVVSAVHRALQYFAAHRQALLQISPTDAPPAAPFAESDSAADITHARAGSAATRDELHISEPAGSAANE